MNFDAQEGKKKRDTGSMKRSERQASIGTGLDGWAPWELSSIERLPQSWAYDTSKLSIETLQARLSTHTLSPTRLFSSAVAHPDICETRFSPVAWDAVCLLNARANEWELIARERRRTFAVHSIFTQFRLNGSEQCIFNEWNLSEDKIERIGSSTVFMGIFRASAFWLFIPALSC